MNPREPVLKTLGQVCRDRGHEADLVRFGHDLGTLPL